jgi:hypothetical protein
MFFTGYFLKGNCESAQRRGRIAEAKDFEKALD